MTGKRSPAKEQTAQQRQRKLATALRTNLRRRKAQSQAQQQGDHQAEDVTASQLVDAPDLHSSIDPTSNQA